MRLGGRLRNWTENDSVLAAVLSGPSVVWIFGIIAYPVILVLWMSVHAQGTVEAGAPFVGLSQYVDILQSTTFWQSAFLTVIWTVGNLLLIVVAGVGVAVLLDLRFFGSRTVQNWALLPWLFPIVVSILMWKWLLDPVAGVVSHLAIAFGLADEPISFFQTAPRAMGTVIFVNVWRWMPFMAIVTLAALKTVSRDLRDQAVVDGASGMQIFIHVTLAQIRPTVSSTAFIITIWLFNMFPPIWLMTQGGPGTATTILPILIYKRGLQSFKMGEASVISVLLLVVFVIPTAAAYFRTFGRESNRD